MRRPTATALSRPAPQRLPHLLLAALGAALTVGLATGCGRGDNQRNPDADTTGIPGAGPGTAVGANEAGKDSAYVAAQRQLDSAQASGATVSQGLDSLAARGAAAANNDVAGQDTNAAMRNQRSKVGRP